MFGNTAENERLKKENAELQKENTALKEQIAALQHTVDTMELTFYRKIFQQIHFDVRGSFGNEEKV